MTGIVRAARRPPGWTAPGPPPSPPPDHAALGPHDGEDLCYLSGDWRILQRLDGHRWSLDDLVTAWCAATAVAGRPPSTILDLGCGIGTVLLLLAWRFPLARVVGVEAQAISLNLAQRSIRWNGVGGRCEAVGGDLRDGGALPADARFDLVTGTPPYLPLGTATASTRPQVAPAHLELRGGIEAYCEAAAHRLVDDGCFVVCESAAQDARVRAAVAATGLSIAARTDVVPREGKAPLFSVYTLGRGPTASRAPDTLTVRDRAGRRTDAFRAVRAAMGLPP